ncbi:uncharacterized protein LOC135488385 [Lineus longissimus]|uniref:uncharacterized protein LOC135488385 n=1 Tax=Lineus longissimus TaxID=88925 RepID=UPI00315DF878
MSKDSHGSTPCPVNASSWRGLGGRVPSKDSIEFDKQLDKISLWIERWDHLERCHILEIILNHSNYNQFQFLWTVMQPALHRDFMYSAKSVYPTMNFTPISTTISRAMKDKLMRTTHKESFHRIKSAYLRDKVLTMGDDGQVISLKVKKGQTLSAESVRLPSVEQDTSPVRPNSILKNSQWVKQEVRCVSKDTDEEADDVMSKKPNKTQNLLVLTHPDENMSQRRAKSNKPKPASTKPESNWNEKKPKSAAKKQDKKDKEVSLFVKEKPSVWEIIQSGPATLRFLEMAPRRHIQDEECPRQHLSEMDRETTNTSEAYSIRSWKKRRKDRKTARSHSECQFGPFKPLPEIQVQPNQNLEPHQGISSEGWQTLTWYTNNWDDVQRNEFLHKVLLKLDPRQHYFISSFLSVKQYRDFMLLLPEKIAIKILGYLSPAELITAGRVCKRWQKLCNSNRLWKAKCEEVQLDVPIIQSNPKWKTIFRENLYLRANWTSGKCRVVDIKGHTHSVFCVTFDYRRMVTGSLDRTIKLWDIKTGNLLQTLRGHLKGVWCLQFFTDSLLVSGSYDCTLRIWNLRTGLTLRTLIGHDGPIWAIVRRNNTMISGSQDKTAKVWDVSRCMMMRTLKGHTGAVFAVDMDEEGTLAITGSADRSVRVWEVATAECTRLIWASHSSSIMSVSWSKGFIACSSGEIISVYNMEEGRLIRTYNEHKKRIECIKIKIGDPTKGEGMIVSGGKDGMVKYWDLASETSIQTFEGHTDSVNCIAFNELQIASASLDNKIKIWDFNLESP